MDEQEITRNRWKTRRKMAWGAFIYIMVIVPLLLFMKIFGADISVVSGIVITIVGSCATIISVYIGASAYDDVNK